MSFAKTALAIVGGAGAALAADKFLNDGEIADKITSGAGSFVTERIKEGGTQIVKEVVNNTREVFTEASQAGKNFTDNIKENVGDFSFDLPGFDLPTIGSNTKTPSVKRDNVASGGLAGRASDALGLGVFYSGVNNIKNFGVGAWTGQDTTNFKTKYGVQTALVGESKGNPISRTYNSVKNSFSGSSNKNKSSGSSSSSSSNRIAEKAKKTASQARALANIGIKASKSPSSNKVSRKAKQTANQARILSNMGIGPTAKKEKKIEIR